VKGAGQNRDPLIRRLVPACCQSRRGPSFERDIRPIFDRLAKRQRVNAGFAAAFGWDAPNDFSSREQLEAMAAAASPRAAEELDLSGIDKVRPFPHGLRRRCN
jgi:hypothetical protein